MDTTEPNIDPVSALKQALDAVAEATVFHRRAVETAREARGAEVQALNALNERQKVANKLMGDVQREAYHETDWGRERARGERIPV